MRRFLAMLAAVSAAGLSPVLAVTCPTVAPPAVTFSAPSYIDPGRAGGEPVSVVAQDGSILVSAHAGTTHLYKDRAAVAGTPDFVVGYTNQTLNWRSTDDGQTWTYIGLAGAPAGPHSLSSTGFSDPDYAIDEAGTIYNTEIDLANISVYSSLDDGQSFPIGHPQVTPGDRPWLTAQAPGEVFLVANAFIGELVLRSTDGGLTWLVQNSNAPVAGKMHVDPLNRQRGLIAPSRDGGVAISTNEGVTWRRVSRAPLESTQFFPAVAVDPTGWVYMAGAGGYTGPSDRTPNATVTFSRLDRATEIWRDTDIPVPAGDALWPWIVAGDEGRAAMVWYQSLAGDPNTFYIYAAITHNANGTKVTCSDGSTITREPRFTVVNASGRPVHVGNICLSGTACNLSTNAVASDRRLGDFLTLNMDADGDLFITSGDTMLKAIDGGPKPVANPIFIAQSGGDRMYAVPKHRRPTRCLTPLPVC